LKITHEFTVARPVPTVWDFFQDVPEVAACLPGAHLVSDEGGGLYRGRASVRLGAFSVTFDGSATVVTDAVTHAGTITGKGSDSRGGSRGAVKVTYRLVPDGEGTMVVMEADVTLSGAAARFGRSGIITEMSTRLIGEFVTCVEAKLAVPTHQERVEIAAAEVRGLSLLWTGLVAWVRRLFGRGGATTP
jgi:carbon monoxide dehydrogenase subunit G